MLDTRFHDVSDKIVRSIDKVGAGGEIVVSTFTLNDRAFLDSLRAAQERGVSVVLYVEATAKLPAEAYELGSAIKRVSMPHGIQHDKTVVCHENGSYKTYYGSANRTCGHNSVDQVFLTQSAEFGSNHMQKLHDMLAPYVQKQ